MDLRKLILALALLGAFIPFAKTLHAWAAARGDGKGHLVFAPAKYLSNRQLLDHGVTYAPLPFALYRES